MLRCEKNHKVRKKACCGILEGARIFFEGIKWFFFRKMGFFHTLGVNFVPIGSKFSSVRNFRLFFLDGHVLLPRGSTKTNSVTCGVNVTHEERVTHTRYHR